MFVYTCYSMNATYDSRQYEEL